MSSKIVLLSLLVSSCLFGGEITLNKAYELSLKNDFKLKANYLRTLSEEEKENQIKAKLYPQIQGSVSSGYYEYGEEYLKDKKVKENYLDYSLSLTQAIYHPEYIAGISQAKTKYESSMKEYEGKSQDLGLKVFELYFTVLKEKEKRELILSQKKYYEEKFSEIEKMMKVGMSNKIDLIDTKIEKDKLNVQLTESMKKIEVAKMKLSFLVGEDIDNIKKVEFKDFNLNKEELLSKIGENPYLKAAGLDVKAAREEVSITNYEYYPKVDLSLNRKESDSSDKYVHNYDNQAIIKVSVPIYQGGYTNSKKRENLLVLNSVQKEEEFRKKEILVKFEETWSDRSFLILNRENLKESLLLAEENLGYLEKAQKAGVKTVLDVLEAKARIVKIKKDLVESEYDLLNNYFVLLNLTGELSLEKVGSF